MLRGPLTVVFYPTIQALVLSVAVDCLRHHLRRLRYEAIGVGAVPVTTRTLLCARNAANLVFTGRETPFGGLVASFLALALIRVRDDGKA